MATDILKRRGSDADFSFMPWLFPRPLRDGVCAFGRLVRLADDVTDDARLSIAERCARLDALDDALAGAPVRLWSEDVQRIAQDLLSHAGARRTGPGHARRMIAAFREDLDGRQHASWADLMAYCDRAAAPIGRCLLDLMGEDLAACGMPSDALCAALRILKMLRACRDETIPFNRLCIPEDFIADAHIDASHIHASVARGQTRAVFDRVLDGVEHLLDDAVPLPGRICCRGLRIYAAAASCRGQCLATRFRMSDPLQDRMALTWIQRTRCLAWAWARSTSRHGGHHHAG